LELAVSVGIVIACSSLYRHHLQPHLDSIMRLERKPDEITLVTDGDFTAPMITRVVHMDLPWCLGDWYNAGVEATETEWVAWSGADDLYRPTALNSLDNATADVVCFGLHYSTGMNWLPQGITPEAILKIETNLITCGSPFRRKLWEEIPFQAEVAPVEDWGFWVGCALQGARFESAHQIDIDYAHGPDHLAPDLNNSRELIRAWLNKRSSSGNQ
jgi:hypothetical protein